jgi:hypothetical protein
MADPGAQPVTQASGRTLIDYLKEYLTRPDVVEQMKPVEAAFIGFLKVYGGMFQMMWTVMQRAVEPSCRFRKLRPFDSRSAANQSMIVA